MNSNIWSKAINKNILLLILYKNLQIEKGGNFLKKLLTIILMIIIVLQISISKVEAIEPASSEIYEGIDVSNWQGNINSSY